MICSDLAAQVSFYFILSLFSSLGWIPTFDPWDKFADWITTYFPWAGAKDGADDDDPTVATLCGITLVRVARDGLERFVGVSQPHGSSKYRPWRAR